MKQVALGLERRGYLRLVPDRHDRRATRIKLTGKVAILDAPDTRAQRMQVLDSVFGGLGPDKVEALSELVSEWLAIEADKQRGTR